MNAVSVSASAEPDSQLAANPLAVDVPLTDNSIIHSPVRISSQLSSVTSFRRSRLAETERGDKHSAATTKHLQKRCDSCAVSENILKPEGLLSDRPAIPEAALPLPGYVIPPRTYVKTETM